jgi:curved DNA-binding protein CbpA
VYSPPFAPVILKDYYKILRVSRLSKEDEIKRSFRRLVSKYHPDVNPDPNAHAILIEINEAYGVLGDQNLKWQYDQILNYQQNTILQNFTSESEPIDPRKARRGHKETSEEREQKRVYAIQRNRTFNRRLKILSVLSFLISGIIFIDHYLPKEQSDVKAYLTFKLKNVILNQEGFSIFLNNERKINMIPFEINDNPNNLNDEEVLVFKTPLLGIIREIQIEKYTFKPQESLFDIMLFYGMVCLASMFVINYKTEESIVLPAILTFFCNMLVAAFFILWLTE